MITNKGKDILSKYLVGQANSGYANYIVIGSGAKPLNKISYSISNKQITVNTTPNPDVYSAIITTTTNHNFIVGDYVTIANVDSRFNGTYMVTNVSTNTITYVVPQLSTVSSTAVFPYGTVSHNYSNKDSLDFEMLRVPIISRGYVNDESGVSKLALTATIPSTNRYEISEVGVYSMQSDPTITGLDTNMIYSFDDAESWKYFNGVLSTAIPTTQTSITDISYNIDLASPTRINSDNILFSYGSRTSCRYLNRTILVPGNMSVIANDFAPSSNYIYIDGVNLNLSKNSPDDEVKIAFSLINKTASNTSHPYAIRLVLDFKHTDGTLGRLPIELLSSDYNSFSNKYIVVTKKLSSLIRDSGFSWGSVQKLFIYAEVINSSGNTSGTDNYLLGLDGILINNVSSINPLYGMVGYSVITDSLASTVYKMENTSSFIEFRFALDVT